MTESNDDSGFFTKLIATGVIVVLAIPGLIIEPGPISELVAIGLLTGIWLDGESPGEAVQEATGTE